MSEPVICFGQQPCGFFPKRFLVAKMETARRLQKEIGGEIVFFYHDSDHDPRETKTTLRHRKTDEPAQLNFAFENKTQRKWSPLYLKQIAAGWQEKTIRQLGGYVDKPLVDKFKTVAASTAEANPNANIADFCLEIYREMGLLEGIKIMRSSDAKFRSTARDISDYFVDIPYENEIVRARYTDSAFKLHEGGEVFVDVPLIPFEKIQISPARDTRLLWMQSVIKCTHYVTGAGEAAYLNREEAPEIEFITRDTTDRSDEAYTDLV